MSFNYNYAIFAGRLTKNPEFREQNGRSSLLFTLAINRPYKTKDGQTPTDFIPIIFWENLAKNGVSYLRKGNTVLISGRIQVRTYDKDNDKKWFTELVADSFQVLEKNKTTKVFHLDKD